MIKRAIHQVLVFGENILDRLFGRTGKGRFVDAYIGYGTPEHVVLRGRVLSKLRHADTADGQSRFSNFRQMVRMFLTDEVRDVVVRSGDASARTDEEGYFTLHVPRRARTGWISDEVHVEGGASVVACPAFIPNPQAHFMVISDIDDTVLETGAYSLLRNLYTSLTGNAATRHIFADAVDLMNKLSEDGRNPVYYVSSSPWNLHDFLADVFENAGLVRGPMFLRDLGLSKTKFITSGHGSHKGESIDAILAANPDLPAVLLGDTGQHDARIYHKVIERHTGRIIGVGLRMSGAAGSQVHNDLEALRATDIPLHAAEDFGGFGDSVPIAGALR